jgi:protein-L-isoaspartate(D-aspartate) O-methyltransferase
MVEIELSHIRRFYAEELRAAAPVRRNEAVVEAFATVPRERFLGPGPWRIVPPKFMNAAYLTPDGDPRWVYHDVLVAIDETRGINNGEPALWARLFDQIDLKPGDRVMQVGAGTGYYSAVIAEIVRPSGRVTAVEYDADLAARASDNLRPWRHVEVVAGDGTRHDPGEVDAIITFAGTTGPAGLWLDRLTEGGQLLVAITADDGWGFFLHVTRRGAEFAASSLGPAGFFHCIGGRDADAARRLAGVLRALGDEDVPVRSLHRGAPAADQRDAWYAGPGFWLSTEPNAAH